MADNNQNQNQAPYQVPYQPQQTIIVVGQDKKSPVLAFFLTFFFGPLGLFYASITGGIVMLILDIFVAIFTFGIGLLFTNIICVIWAMSAVSKYNKKNSNPHQFQQFQQPQQPQQSQQSQQPQQPQQPQQSQQPQQFQQQTNAYQAPPQQHPNPITQPPPTQQFSNTPPVAQQFTQTNAVNQPQNDIGEAVSNAINNFADWVTKNKKALLIGVGCVIGLTVLLTVVRVISSMRFVINTIGLLNSTQTKRVEPAPVEPTPSVTTKPEPHMVTLGQTHIEGDSLSAMEATVFVKTPTGSNLDLYASPKANSKILATIPNGTPIIIIKYDNSYSVLNGDNGKWCQIYNGDKQVGWVWGNYLEHLK